MQVIKSALHGVSTLIEKSVELGVYELLKTEEKPASKKISKKKRPFPYNVSVKPFSAHEAEFQRLLFNDLKERVENGETFVLNGDYQHDKQVQADLAHYWTPLRLKLRNNGLQWEKVVSIIPGLWMYYVSHPRCSEADIIRLHKEKVYRPSLDDYEALRKHVLSTLKGDA